MEQKLALPTVASVTQAIIDALPFEPTNSQRDASECLAKLICSQDARPTLIINGFAGTGKTSLMRAFCDVAEHYRFPLCLMAPTGRAAKVLSSFTGRSAHTIHRTIYRQQVVGEFSSPFSLGFSTVHHTIFIVDEASMISDQTFAETEFGSGRLLTDLIAFAFQQRGCRLLLIGDPAQLPPVGLNQAPALDINILRSFALDAEQCWLKDIVRQEAESEILINANSLRDIIENQPNFCGFPMLTAARGTDVERLSGEDLIETLVSCNDKYGTENTIVITRSNKRANRFNQGIRATVLLREELITRGDLLMISKNNYLWLNDKNGDFIANGDICEVVRIGKYQDMHEFRYADVSLRFKEHDDIDIDAKIILTTLTSDSAKLTQDQERQIYDSVQRDYADILDHRKRYEALRNDVYLNALQPKYAYAVTCHKAQGGQWDAVFVDVGYVTEDMLTTEYLKWLYTAFTRARRKLYLVNFPKEFFGEK